jgi:hypothetical protein
MKAETGSGGIRRKAQRLRKNTKKEKQAGQLADKGLLAFNPCFDPVEAEEQRKNSATCICRISSWRGTGTAWNLAILFQWRRRQCITSSEFTEWGLLAKNGGFLVLWFSSYFC